MGVGEIFTKVGVARHRKITGQAQHIPGERFVFRVGVQKASTQFGVEVLAAPAVTDIEHPGKVVESGRLNVDYLRHFRLKGVGNVPERTAARKIRIEHHAGNLHPNQIGQQDSGH